MPDVERGAVEPVDEATVAAIEEIRAAMSSAGDLGESPTPEAPPDPPAAAESGPAPGHGTIRLHGHLPRPTEAPATTQPAPDAAVAAGPIGHGVIRLRTPAPPEPIAEPGPVGHGPVLLYGATFEGEPRFAFPCGEVDDTATVAARHEILAALAATT